VSGQLSVRKETCPGSGGLEKKSSIVEIRFLPTDN